VLHVGPVSDDSTAALGDLGDAESLESRGPAPQAVAALVVELERRLVSDPPDLVIVHIGGPAGAAAAATVAKLGIELAVPEAELAQDGGRRAARLLAADPAAPTLGSR
jgi:hypothetical protein